MAFANDIVKRYSVHLALVNDRIGLIVMTAIFSLLIVLVTAGRFYARWLSRVDLAIDDWLALVSLVFVLALNGIFLAATIQGAITGHSIIVDNWPLSTPLEHLVQKYKYAFQITEKIAFGSIKLSLLFLWKSIFTRSRPFLIVTWFLIAFIVAWSVSFLFITIFQCGLDWKLNWAPIATQLEKCVSVLSLLTAYSTLDLFTDFVILSMPVPMIWRLSMPTRKKLGVTAVFGVGLFTIGAGIARLYYYLVTSYDKEDNPDFIADFTLFILWSDIEANVAMIVCCMPTLSPVLGRCGTWLNHGLRRVLPSSWMLLSVEKGYDASTDQNLAQLDHSQSELPKELSDQDSPWHSDFGTVTAAGYSDRYEPLGDHQGIRAHTEIIRTSGPR
ncbi:hypothetical protein F5Y03DRAFT_349424 [Xylaria venustula]|nr:hypothetical protein F5Y03DRAFT_349424 [Xylaria venustula]